MDKISSILPSSARVSSVDLREAAPVRPGAPGFGRPEGASSLRDGEIARSASRTAATTAQKGDDARHAQMDWRAKEERGAAIARSMSDQFFIDRRKEAESARAVGAPMASAGAVATVSAEASRPVNARDLDVRAIGAGQRFGAAASTSPGAPVDADSLLPPTDEFYPRGSFVDRQA